MDWRKIEDYEYSINENGQVRNDITSRILKPSKDRYGYCYICLYKNGISKTFKIHRLLAQYFLDDFSKELDVDHIDRNRLNNNLDNLRMVTTQENCHNSSKRKNCSSIYKGITFRKDYNKWRSIIQINGKKIHIGHFDSELKAAEAYNKYLDDNNLIYHVKNNI